MEMLRIMSVTPLYAGALGLFFIALSLHVIRLRWKFKTGIGTGGHRPLDKAIRVHGNFAEYTAMGLLLMALSEVTGTSHMTLHVIGSCLLVGRLSHAIGLTKSIGTSAPRFSGMILTFASIIISSLTLLIS